MITEQEMITFPFKFMSKQLEVRQRNNHPQPHATQVSSRERECIPKVFTYMCTVTLNPFHETREGSTPGKHREIKMLSQNPCPDLK